ncbi:MAG: DoxX-like family protein [Bryobacteraceae bacterium]|nr:DoxX-like family protein [Bryobacteraceae bacterium]
MAQPRWNAGVDLPAWKTAVALLCAILLGVMWIVAGGWKLTGPFEWAIALTQFKVPGWLALPGTIALGISEMLAGVLLFIPRFRRWGAILSAILLVVFMAYMGVFYDELRGKDCSCFPMVKRTVGPAFFIGDGVMLVMCLLAGWWSRVSEGLKTAAMILGAVAVFAGMSYGVAVTQQSGTKAPQTIMVDGKPVSLGIGRFFIYFFDPECTHCDEAARRMAKWNWRDTRVVGVPTRMPQFSAEFMQSTKLQAPVTSDLKLLKDTFPFQDAPFGVALENGRQKEAMGIFDAGQPEKRLRELGFIE